MTTFSNHWHAAIPCCLFVVLLYSCQKEKSGNGPGTVTAPPPVVNTGADITIKLPVEEVTLSGGFVNATNSVQKAGWKKISGPDFYHIENPDKVITRVTGLKEGAYAFELALTNTLNMTGRDTVGVIVLKPDPDPVIVGNDEVTFTNIQWIYPWYNALEAKQIYTFIPQNKPIKVFVKRDGASNWIEVPPVSSTGTSAYEYFIETRPDGAGMYTMGSLYVFYYGMDTGDTPDVKVVY